MRNYDPESDAASRGIEVVRASLPFGCGSWWVPSERAIIIDERLDDTWTRAWLTHQLIHAELDGSKLVDDVRSGAVTRDHLEGVVSEIQARRTIGLRTLAAAIAADPDPNVIADAVGTVPELVYLRVAQLSPFERDYLGDLPTLIPFDKIEFSSYRCGQMHGLRGSGDVIAQTTDRRDQQVIEAGEMLADRLDAESRHLVGTVDLADVLGT